MKTAYWISLLLVVIGALNWGLVGVFQFDLVATLFGPASALSRIVYALVGVAGISLAGIAATSVPSHHHAASPLPAR